MESVIIVMSLFKSPMLDKCINTLLSSDYTGNIIVSSYNSEVEYISSLSDRIKFVKTTPRDGIDPNVTLMHDSIMSLDKIYDNIILIHNDVIVPPLWYNSLVNALALGGDRVWGIALPHIWHKVQHRGRDYDKDISELSYSELIDKYKGIECNYGTYTTNSGQLLGLGVDMFNSTPERVVVGRWSPCVSFKHDVYLDAISKYDGNNCHVIELYMLLEMIKNNRWCVWCNTTPVIHYSGYDGIRIDNKRFHAGVVESYHKFFSYMGYNLEHLITVWSRLLCADNRDIIVDAINENSWNDIDHIFDAAQAMLDIRECSKCMCGSICPANNNIGHPHPW